MSFENWTYHDIAFYDILSINYYTIRQIQDVKIGMMT